MLCLETLVPTIYVNVLLMCTPISALLETLDVQPRLQIAPPGGLLKANPQWVRAVLAANLGTSIIN